MVAFSTRTRYTRDEPPFRSENKWFWNVRFAVVIEREPSPHTRRIGMTKHTIMK
jgi:hypothetical protein